MPFFPGQVGLNDSAKAGNIILAEVERIKGAFKIYTSADAQATSPNYFSDGQIIYLSDSASLSVALKNWPPVSFEMSFKVSISISFRINPLPGIRETDLLVPAAIV